MNRKQSLSAVVLAIIVFFPTFIHAQSFDWTISSQGKNVDEGTSICVDVMGNSYIAGSFMSSPFGIGDFSFGNSTKFPQVKAASASLIRSLSRRATNMFVAKVDKTGHVVWAIQSKGSGEEKATGITCDRTGHVVVVGTFTGRKAVFGTHEIANPRARSKSIFILKVNGLGKINWVRNEATKGIKPTVKTISSGPDGEFYITGTFIRRATFSGKLHNSKNGNNPTAYVAKYLSNGHLKWLHQIHSKSGGGQTSQQSGEAIFATKDSRFVYVAGWFRGHVKFGEGKVITSNNFKNKKGIPWQRNFFITKYTSDGKEVWTQSVGVNQVNLSSSPRITGIVVDHEGSSFITGYFPGRLLFGENSLKTKPSRNRKTWNFDIFLAKLDQNGKHLWQRTAGDSNGDKSESIALTPKGVVITGNIWGKVQFGKYSLLSKGFSMFVAEYDTNGNALRATSIKGRSFLGLTNWARQVAVNGENMMVIGNYFGSQPGFGNVRSKEIGMQNIFVARIR